MSTAKILLVVCVFTVRPIAGLGGMEAPQTFPSSTSR